ncbi:MAG TPA: glycoside hydrolase family 65 protein [Clostridia bacterium]|nr:glycoside hydrolase family 65 protein [Clostridia bacterium]
MKPSLVADRRFRIIAFDWDGTAVASRAEDATPVRGPLERLLRCGVLAVVISGTNLRNIDCQLSRAIRGRHKRNLYLATNRGSEVYGFDERFEPTLLWQRTASPEEERKLTRVADAVRDHVVSRTGLDVRVIYDRLNRRKVDLIPLEEWKEPPKSALGDLFLAVETRLVEAGITGGIQEIIEFAQCVAREKGLLDARITSDVKHVEIGLTDKADSVAWVISDLAVPRGVRPEEILICGDEFGPIAGFPGSDSRMLIAGAGVTFISVGPEPGGVPGGVVHMPGGPPMFATLLAAQAALYPLELPSLPEQRPEWFMVEEGFVPAREHEIESLFASSNGFVGSRGSLAEGSVISAPATFVAGVFDSEPGAAVPGLARAPNWGQLSISVDGNTLRLDSGEQLEHRRILDLRHGILWRHWRHRDSAGRITSVRGMRLASLADRHLLLQSVTITPENYSGSVSFASPAFSRSLLMRTGQGVSIGLFARSHIEDSKGRRTPQPQRKCDGEPEPWTVEVDLGETCRLDRLVGVHTSQDSNQPLEAARETVQHAYENSIELAVEDHTAAWEKRWDASDIVIEGDADAQRAIRFAIYHLISAANPENEHVSIGARALTGPAYKGHVFWDTEIFVLPLFLLTYPEAARALLMYRYNTLPAARARAARLGYHGALYAWESAETGDDVTPSCVIMPNGKVIPVLAAEQEHHISADVAYGVWSYWQATADEQFLIEAGAEILFETARFWAIRAQPEEDGRYHIRRVIGPDEYHESVDDNAYTNGMAKWNLETAAEAFSLLDQRWPDQCRELSRRLRIGSDEREGWLRVAQNMYLGFDTRTGLFEQFQGYFGLEEIDIKSYEPRTTAMDVLLGRERIQHSQVIKQADVLMLLYLLWDRFPVEVHQANFRYYLPRSGHGSSLSPPVHAAIAARLGYTELAECFFKQTAEIDLANNMGNAAGGVHAAALGGLWQAVVFGFAGLNLTPEGPRANPQLPASWREVRFAVQWRGERVAFELRQQAQGVAPAQEAHP